MLVRAKPAVGLGAKAYNTLSRAQPTLAKIERTALQANAIGRFTPLAPVTSGVARVAKGIRAGVKAALDPL